MSARDLAVEGGEEEGLEEELVRIRARLNKLEDRDNYGKELRDRVDGLEEEVRGLNQAIDKILNKIEETNDKYERILEELDKREEGEV